jgi:uncharacterized protein
MRPILDKLTETYSVTAYKKGQIQLGVRLITEPCLIFPDALHFPPLPPDAAALEITHFSIIMDKQPEVIIVGTGATQIFISRVIIGECNEKMIGVECMDTAAACRCFNILLAEGRYVAALLYMV